MPETNAIVELLEKYLDGRPWAEIDRETGIQRGTREGWSKGKIERIPLIGMAKVARALGVPDAELLAVARGQEAPEAVSTLVSRVEAVEATLAGFDEVRLRAVIREETERFLRDRAPSVLLQARDHPGVEGGTSTPQ